jgi:hypothetical protein
MVGPHVLSRIEKGNQLSAFGVDSREIRSLVAIAVDAGESEVREIIAAHVLASTDMLEMVTSLRVLLGEKAILASFPGSLPHEVAYLSVHQLAS